MELLQRAGLEIAGDWRTEEVLPPRAAWRPIVAGETTPTVSVRGDQPDLVAELNAQWHRLATESGILGEDGVFFIDVAGDWTGCAPRRWTRVRLTSRWDLAGVLGERPGQPEFVTLSMDGNTLLGATTEEDEIWLIAVDQIRERQKAAAQVAAQETPQERAAAWASLLQGSGPSKRLREIWAHGLALNPATPDALRAGLLGLSHFLLWRRLPAAVVEAAIVHPEWKVRQLLAEAQPDLAAEQWARLILGEQDARHRWILTPPSRNLLRYADDPNPRMRRLALDDPESTAELVERFSWDSDEEVRHRAASDPRLMPESAVRLLDDPHERVRNAAARHPRLPARVLVRLLRDTDTAQTAAQNPALPISVMEQMFRRIQPPTSATRSSEPVDRCLFRSF
ncbi:HEAT repeat domain-containing protein [Streptomyces jeddahensis]|nr:hypothetical protein [Streptomyces jeddahensis]